MTRQVWQAAQQAEEAFCEVLTNESGLVAGTPNAAVYEGIK